MKERQSPISVREAAKDLIRPYVLRGEPVESLGSSSLGAVNERYRARIDHRKQIGVVVVGANEAEEWVGLVELYNDVRAETIDEQPIQAKLF